MLRLTAGTLFLAAAALASPSGAALSPRYDHSAIGVPASPADTLEQLEGGAKRYASLIALHGVLGFLAWQVVAPLAVVIAAVGKSWGPVWFRAHWRMQMFFVAPVTITGYVILGAIAFQALAGFYSHHRQVTVERFAAENGRPVPEPKRRLSNWVHMALGIGLLTITGLEITWGIYEFKDKTGVAVPTWLVVLHWVVAGLPVLIVAPFIIIRGILRPRKLFLNSSTYLSTPVFDVDIESEKASSVGGGGGGGGYANARGGGADGRQRVDSLASSSWPGAATREEYEAEVASLRAPGAESVVGSSAASFASWTTVARDYPSAEGVEDDDGAESVTLLSAAGVMGATNERKHGAGPPQPASSPAPATYPPTPIATRNVVSTTPSLPPLPAIFSPVSSPARLPPTAAATASPLSPRLSFMPFPGGAPVHPPAPPSSVGSSPALTLAPSLVSSSEVGEGEGAGAYTPRLVPTPDAALQRARHGSLAAQVVDATPTPAQGDGLLPLPGEPDGNKTDSSGSDEEEDGTGVRDDSESTRLMDELERELTISTMRSGRSARSATAAPAMEQQQEGQKAKEESQEAETQKDDEQTQLEREQSGKWFGSNRLSSSS
ncbi:hypothetical protein JCM10450v2_006138 [Rhodotorula kratochvilovae]